MTEFRLVRGTQITVYADESPLFGLISFSASQQIQYHEVYEYLSAEPCDRVPQGKGYAITMRFLSMFDSQLPEDEAFTLTVADGDTRYIYKDCRMTSRKTELRGNEHAEEVIKAQADTMEKQVIANE